MSAQTHSDGRRVAVLGLGIMAGPMARHLGLAGHQVRAWDIDPDRAAALAADGVTVCETAAEATDAAEVAVTMPPDAAAVREVMDGRHQALSRFDGLWIQTSTAGLEGTRQLLTIAERAGVVMVDAPLLGTKPSAEAGKLTALASGPAEVESLAREVLDSFSERVLWLGEAGEGSRLKLVVNGWVLGLITLTAETMALSSGLGLPPTAFLDIIRGGPLDVEQAHIKGMAMLAGELAPALPLRLAAKDAGLIVAAGHEAGVPLRVAAAVAEQPEVARVDGHGDEDVAAVWFAVRPDSR